MKNQSKFGISPQSNLLFRCLFIAPFLIITGLYLTSCAATSDTGKQSVRISPLQQDPEIAATEIQDHIRYLASDKLEGRQVGSETSREAMAYLATQMEAAGIEPAGTDGYYQTFDFTDRVELGDPNLLTINGVSYTVEKDFIPLGFAADSTLTAGAVFVGYGFVIDEDSLQWNDYSNVDVDGKWAVVVRGGPDLDTRHSPFADHLALRKKVLVARDQGAAGVIFVTSPFMDPGLIELRYDQSAGGAGLPVLHITQAVATDFIAPLGDSLTAIVQSLNDTQKPMSQDLPAVTIEASIHLTQHSSPASNIVGIVRGSDPVLRDEYIAIGAHFDHLGWGGKESGSMKPDTVAVHNGADDNASGTAGVLELGEWFAAHASDLKRSVLLVAFDGEERGLLGSKYFVQNPTAPLNKIVFMINMDMVGRMENKEIAIGGTGTRPDLETILNEFNRAYRFELGFNAGGYGPSDHASFYTNDIPVLFFFTGTHEDYHKPSDDWQKINADGEASILKYVADLVSYFATEEAPPEFTEAGPSEAQTSRREFKVTFGIVPAYTSQIPGLEVDGVRPDGPADKGGILKGDVITAIDGKDVKDIYDYMYRLGELEPGQTVSVTVQRGEETIVLEVGL